MVKKTVHKLLKRRHFWRDVDFDELSEIYISMMLRSLSVSMSGIFIPLYMLKLHYGVVDVMMFFAWYYFVRTVFFDFFAGMIVAKIGPKRTMLLSYIPSVISTTLFLLLAHTSIPIWLLGVVGGMGTSLFWVPFHTNFSQVKHAAHGGKELAYMSIMTKVGSVVGPFIGGIVATIFGGQYVFVFAVIIQLLGCIPLLLTSDTVHYKQSLDLSMIRLRSMTYDIISNIAYSTDQVVSAFLWPLYLGAYILVSKTAYAKLGFIASASVLVAMVVAYTIGQLVDKSRGRLLLRTGATVNTGLNLIKPFITTYSAAFAINTANEAVSVTYQLPYSKGMYNAGDERASHRISYFVVMEAAASFARMCFWLLLILLTLLISERDAVRSGFLIGAIMSLTIMAEKYKALNQSAS